MTCTFVYQKINILNKMNGNSAKKVNSHNNLNPKRVGAINRELIICIYITRGQLRVTTVVCFLA
jgi:hypothetical protein